MIRWDEAAARLQSARAQGRTIVLGTHVNADGDGLGSELGLWHFLRSEGYRATMINNDPVSRQYSFLRGSEEIRVYDAGCAEVIRDAGVFVVLDNSSPERLGRLLPDLTASGAFKICIDHHAMVDPFWDLNCVDVEAAATGHLVYDAIRQMGGAITPEIAEALYVSFVTDTGHFRFSKTTPEVHRIAADLIEKGSLSPPRIYRFIFEDHTRGRSRLVGHALSETHYELGGRFAWARFTRSQLEQCNGVDEDTGDLVNMLLAVEGVEAAALFKELPEGRTKVSLRSRGDVDVNGLATRFGGGGHKNASGILMAVPLEESIRSVVAGMMEVLAPA